jgi:5,10-methylenetetrahydrofolate reductase
MGELLGAKATGIDTVYLVNGAVLPEGYSPRPVAVMDTQANDLIETAQLMNEQEDLVPGSEILIGASATVHDPSPEKNPGKLLAKADAGAKLMITQICMNNEVLRRYMEFLVNRKLLQRFSVIVSVAIVTSPELAQWLKDNRLRTIIHDDLIERLAAADDGETAAVEFTRGLVQEIQTIPGVAGINFTAASELHLIPEVLSGSGGPR